jgi:hypothetical protein
MMVRRRESTVDGAWAVEQATIADHYFVYRPRNRANARASSSTIAMD